MTVADEIVITGASGWFGRNFVEAVAPVRSRTRVLVPTEGDAAVLALIDRRIEPVVGDVRHPHVIDELFDGVAPGASVVHAAAVIHPTEGVRELFDVNVGGTALMLDRARRHGAGRLVHLSSNSPFGVNPSATHRFDESSPFDPYLGYGASKREAEELVQTAAARGDVDAVIVRPPWFYGPNQPARQSQWLRAVRRGRFPLVGDGSNRRSMVYTGNLVHGVLCAEDAAATGSAYWIADPEPIAMREVLATVRAAFEAEGLPVSGGQLALPRVAGVVAEAGDRLLQRFGRYSQPLHVLGELKETIACDVGRATAEIGYRPATDLLEGMRASIRWCLEHGHQL